jgi:hypothetical protein
MKRSLTLLIILALAGMAVLPAAAADGCPAPRIFVMPTKVNSDLITQDVGDVLNDAYANGLQNANSAVKILSAHDVGALLNLRRDQILLGTDIDQTQALATIAQSTNAEYIATLTVGNVGSRYLVQTTIIDADLFTVIARGSTETASADGLNGAVNAQVAALGDLAALIKAHETAHPVPPRAPSLSVTVQPESVTAEDIRDATTITVTVRNCKGDVVPGTKVYFESQTARGRVTTEEGASEGGAYHGWQFATTGADGTARATYQLDRDHGVGAGSDTVAIATVGRGHKEVRSKATIEITGVILEAHPKDAEIAPRGATDIYISLFELNSDGTKRPLADRSLYVETHRLSNDAKVSVVGPVDSDGNPVTAADGTAVLKFVAGKEERLQKLRIIFQDVGRGYPDAIEAWVEIVVKKDEYVATVNWHESGSLDYEYSWQYDYFLWDYDYDLTLFTKTQKEKNTGQEVTDGTFHYTDTLDYYTEGRTSFETPFSTGYTIVPFEEQWDVNAAVKGTINSHESINTALEERLSTLSIPVTPFPIPFDASGGTDYEMSVVYKIGGNDITYNSDGRVANTEAIRMMGRTPQTGVMGDTIALVNEEDPDHYTTMSLKRMSAAIDEHMEVSDSKLTGLLTKAGENVYAKRWSVHERNSYHADLFTWLSSTARMDMDAEFTREVTLGAVKQ